MIKKNIEIDLDLIAEEVTKVLVDKMGLDEKGKEMAKQINLEALKIVDDEDFQNVLIAHYINRAEKIFKDLGELMEFLGDEKIKWT